MNTVDEQFISRTYQIFFNGQRPADKMITAFALVTIILCTSTRNFTNAFLIQRQLSSFTNVCTSTDCARQRFIVARRLKETSVDTPPASPVADVETAEEDLQEGLRVKLKEEISSPFRKVRQFIYSGAGIAGLIGTVTAVPQLLFAVQDGGEAIAGAITNVAIDLGAVVLAVVLWDKDAEGERIKLERFTRKEKLLSYQMSSTDITDREKDISLLPVEIQVSEKDENATRIVSLGELQSKGKQNIIIVAGKRDFVKDVVISAKIEGADLFNSKEIYVVPVVLEDDQLDAALAKGFGAPKESLMSAPYIGKPMQVSISSLKLNVAIENVPHLLCNL